MPSSTVENYLKQIYLEQQPLAGGELVPMGRLAVAMAVTPGTATTMIKALAEANLVTYEPRTGVRLTRPGEQLALHVLRRHRLVELFLVKVLGLEWSEVHDEAEHLEHAVSDKVRNQDAAIQLAISLDTDQNRELTWKFIQNNWDEVKKEFTPEMGSVLVGATSAFCSEQARDDVSQFFSTHKVPAADQTLKHSIERINGCIELRNLQEPNLRSWLQTQSRSHSDSAH